MTRDVQRWLTHLTEVSGPLTRSLDYDTTLRQVVRLPIPALADWCMVYIPDDGGPVPARLELAHAHPLKEALLRRIWHRDWTTLPEHHPLVQTLRDRLPIVVEDLNPRDLHRLCPLAEDANTLQRVGARSMVILPLVAHGVIIGAVMLVVSATRRRAYLETQRDLLLKLGECYAQAIYNARLFIEARQAVRLKDEVIAATRHQLLELAASIGDHPQTAQSEIRRIAQRLDVFTEPYGRG
jgi:GAF domain-containing protein